MLLPSFLRNSDLEALGGVLKRSRRYKVSLGTVAMDLTDNYIPYKTAQGRMVLIPSFNFDA